MPVQARFLKCDGIRWPGKRAAGWQYGRGERDVAGLNWTSSDMI
jgi:hypothetical protein